MKILILYIFLIYLLQCLWQYRLYIYLTAGHNWPDRISLRGLVAISYNNFIVDIMINSYYNAIILYYI